MCVCVCVCYFGDYINSGGIKTKTWLMNHINMNKHVPLFICVCEYILYNLWETRGPTESTSLSNISTDCEWRV